MAANTPLRRYKQNTHGGGIRDPLVMAWDKGIAARGELRHQFCHASDLVPTLLDVVGIKPPKAINGVKQMPLEGTSFAKSLTNAAAPVEGQGAVFRDVRPSRPRCRTAGRRSRSIRRAATFANDKWELYHLDQRLQRDRRPRREGAGAAEGDDRRMVAPGRGAQGAAARRPLRAALRRQRRALPRPAQPLRLPRRHGPCADRRGARRAQPHLHDRGRRRRSTGR